MNATAKVIILEERLGLRMASKDEETGNHNADELQGRLGTVQTYTENGEYDKAIQSVIEIEKEYSQWMSIRIQTVILRTEILAITEDVSTLRVALEMLEEFAQYPLTERWLSQLNLAIGNAYANFAVKAWMRSNDVRALVDECSMRKARKHTHEALRTADGSDPEHQTRVLVNMGNLMDHIGRYSEALELYDRAIDVSPDHAMAIGNKGLCFSNLSRVCGPYQVSTDLEAYHLLIGAIAIGDKKGTLDIANRDAFAAQAELLKKRFELNGIAIAKVVHTRYDSSSLSEFERFYVEYCRRERLFLNLHVIDDACEAALCDPIFIPLRAGIEDDNAVLDLFTYFNQIKEDYMTARMMLVQSQYRHVDFKRISRRTALVNTGDSSLFNLYVGLLKASIKGAFGVLDKIAVFVNRRYELGLNEKWISFCESNTNKSFWLDKNGKLREEVRSTRNLYLYALYDIFCDFRDLSEYDRLRTIRNSVQHRRLVVFKGNHDFSEEEVSYTQLLSDALRLFRLVKSAIVCIFAAIERERRIEDSRPDEVRYERPLDTAQELDDNSLW